MNPYELLQNLFLQQQQMNDRVRMAQQQQSQYVPFRQPQPEKVTITSCTMVQPKRRVLALIPEKTGV